MMDAAAKGRSQFGQYPSALRTIVHISDTHLLAGDFADGGREAKAHGAHAA